MNTELTIDDVAAAVARGERVLMMTRHGARPHIDPEDPTFGEDLPLTPDGSAMAFDFGRRLAAALDNAARAIGGNRPYHCDTRAIEGYRPIGRAEEDIQFMASPLRRTRLTAAEIARGMGLAERWDFDTIPTDTRIGNGSPYYADARAVWQLFRGGEFYRLSFDYCANGEMAGFRPIGQATEMLEDFVLSRFTGRLGVFTSHDLFIAAFLSGKGAWRGWTEDTWIQFLDSAAIFIAPDGSRRYALIRARA